MTAQRVPVVSTAFSVSRSRQKRPREHNEKHLQWIRSLPCLLTGRRDGVEAAHVRMSDARFGKREVGKAEKADDRWAVPLHHELHRQQHEMNERAFWNAQKIDPCPIALALYNASGDDEIGEVILWSNRMMAKPSTCTEPVGE